MFVRPQQLEDVKNECSNEVAVAVKQMCELHRGSIKLIESLEKQIRILEARVNLLSKHSMMK